MIKINTAEILSVGTELLLGDIVNTDAAYLSKRLAALGIGQYHQSVVGDNPKRLEEALRLSIKRSDLVILTGGLGPTYDDLTKEVAAKLMGREMYLHEESLNRLVERITSRGRTVTENNKKQAYMPKGAVVFKNNYGTAPGLAIEDEAAGKILILLPGPPRELEPMFLEEVEPYLKGFSDKIFYSKTVNILGLGESQVESILKEMMESAKNPTVAPYAKDGEVLLRVTASGKTEEESAALCDGAIEEIKKSPVGEYIYGIDAYPMEKTVVHTLRRHSLTISAAESCTGGLIAKRITDISGASAVLDGSIVTYANEVKERFVGVSHETLAKVGAVSSEVALAMAKGVRALFGSHIGIATTGIAGPDGGSAEKPVGTVYIAISSDGYEEVKRLNLGSSSTRDYIRHVAATNALSLVLSAVKSHKPDGRED